MLLRAHGTGDVSSWGWVRGACLHGAASTAAQLGSGPIMFWHSHVLAQSDVDALQLGLQRAASRAGVSVKEA